MLDPILTGAFSGLHPKSLPTLWSEAYSIEGIRMSGGSAR